jgi:putative tryptophan/tyrosine transport system substrate-binding protein
MKRREFITLLGGAAAARPLRAQQAAMPVIGFLRTASAVSSTHLINAFHEGLSAAGFVEGRNVAVEYRWADDQPHRVSGLAADLVRQRVSIIVTNGIAVPAVREVAGAIPIIFLTGYDPVRTGFVTSLNRPGGS